MYLSSDHLRIEGPLPDRVDGHEVYVGADVSSASVGDIVLRFGGTRVWVSLPQAEELLAHLADALAAFPAETGHVA